MQGLGLYTLEELRFSPSGMLYTRGPSQYKIPAVCDVPLRFNVYLLADAHNPHAIYSSKVSAQTWWEQVEVHAATSKRPSWFSRASANPPSSWAAPCSSPSKTPWRRRAPRPDWSAPFPWTRQRLQRGCAWPVSHPSPRW